MNKIFEYVDGKEWTYKNGVLSTKCYKDFPEVFFGINGKWIELRP